MPGPLLLLLPPSEGKAEGGRARRRAGAFDAALRDERAAVIAALVEATRDPARAGQVLGCTGDLLDRARAATETLAIGRAELLPAADRYTGVVWQHLGPLAPADRTRVLVPSPVYGITTAADPVADHRGRLSVSLPGLGRLDRFWAEPVTSLLARRYRNRTIVDLLPREHARMLDWAVLDRAADVVHVAFVRADGAGAAGHAVKAAKGRFARCLLDEGLDPARSFRWAGWRAVPADDGLVVVSPT